MVVDNKHRSNLFINDQDEPQSSSENGPDSPYSGDELKNITTTTKKRRNIQKRVVTVSIGDQVDGLRSKGEAYPPSDSWAWRKYGQKPIKGSPYPRGYYRCSSFKGCPARKQVERNRVDPTKLVVTYASEHNHPLPTTKHHNHYHNRHNNHQSAATAATSNVTTTTSDGPTNSADLDDPSSPTMQINPFGDQSPQLEFVGDTLVLGNLGVEYCWISDVSFHTPSFMGPTCDDMEGVVFTMKEEDESLFGDLDELPECSTVFRKKFQRCTATSTPLYNTR